MIEKNHNNGSWSAGPEGVGTDWEGAWENILEWQNCSTHWQEFGLSKVSSFVEIHQMVHLQLVFYCLQILPPKEKKEF